MKYCLFIIISFYFWAGNHQQKSNILHINIPEIFVDSGESSTILLMVKVKEGFHIQANKVDEEYLIPTTLVIKSYNNIMIGEQTFPKSKKLRLEGSDEYLNIYDGNFNISILFNTDPHIKKGIHNLTATLQYQACDSKRCFSPKTINLSIPIEVIN